MIEEAEYRALIRWEKNVQDWGLDEIPVKGYWPERSLITLEDLEVLINRLKREDPPMNRLVKECFLFWYDPWQGYKHFILHDDFIWNALPEDFLYPQDEDEAVAVILEELMPDDDMRKRRKAVSRLYDLDDILNTIHYIREDRGKPAEQRRMTHTLYRHILPELKENRQKLADDGLHQTERDLYCAAVRELAALGDQEALEQLAYAPYERDWCPLPPDWQAAAEALKMMMKLDPKDPFTPNTLGYIYYYGRITGEPDYKQARRFFEKGADRGNMESLIKLGDLYANGLGGPKDDKLAANIWMAVYRECRGQIQQGVMDGKFADAAIRLGNGVRDGKLELPPDPDIIWDFYLQADYALSLRLVEGYYGDDSVFHRLHASMEQLRPKVRQMGNVDAIGLSLVMAGQRFIDMDNKATFMLEANEDGDIRLNFSRVAGVEELKPAQALWVIGPLNYAHLVDSIMIYGQDVKRIYTIEPGKPVVYDRVEYDEKTDTCVFLLNDVTQAALMGGHFFLMPSMLPDYGPKRYRVAEAVSDADGSRDEYLCPVEKIGPGDHALARIKGQDVRVIVQAIREKTEDKLRHKLSEMNFICWKN